MSWCQKLALETVVNNLNKPVDISNTGIPDDSKIYIIEKDGRIKFIDLKEDKKETTVFLDIASRVNSAASERGLLGMTFHPNFKENGYFYVHYTNPNGTSIISRFSTISNNSNNLGDPTSEKQILSIPQPFNNHNAGDLSFGRDGYLYIAMGDGGSGGDPGNRSQSPTTLLGKMLRIDINAGTEKYLIPQDNPYANSKDTLPEIWSFGLRNPWRFSFDEITKTIWIADVGQNAWEEINVISDSLSSLNYGWRCYEGEVKFNFTNCREDIAYVNPIHVYPNRFNVGCSVTGGYVYRGKKNTSMYGKYVYADYCSGRFWWLYQDAETGLWKNEELGVFGNQDISSFGVDNEQELYVTGLSSGALYRLTYDTNSNVDNTIQHTLKIYPNPSANILYIEDGLLGDQNTEWIIYNVSGYQVLHTSSHENGKHLLNISNLPKGQYYISNNTLPLSGTFLKN